MVYRVLNEDGSALDAHLDIEANEFILHSRGGKRGQPNARNLDYGQALRLLLDRIARTGVRIGGAWLDSDEVLHLPRDRRSLLGPKNLTANPSVQFRDLSRSMQTFGRASDAPYGGSRVKKLRIRVDGLETQDGLAGILGAKAVVRLQGLESRLPATAFDSVTAEHVWLAVQQLRQRPNPQLSDDTQDFELVAGEEIRMQPKTVIGLAASLALGVEILPEHFTDGANRRCHMILRDAGFEIVRRGDASGIVGSFLTDEDRLWTEGQPRLVLHLKRERAAGLSRAKKQSFIREHGRLRCERCGLDPVKEFGVLAAEAVIEVHHYQLQVADMGDGGQTMLNDVQCLCANCHRLVHAMMRANENSTRIPTG